MGVFCCCCFVLFVFLAVLNCEFLDFLQVLKGSEKTS